MGGGGWPYIYIYVWKHVLYYKCFFTAPEATLMTTLDSQSGTHDGDWFKSAAGRLADLMVSWYLWMVWYPVRLKEYLYIYISTNIENIHKWWGSLEANKRFDSPIQNQAYVWIYQMLMGSSAGNWWFIGISAPHSQQGEGFPGILYMWQ